MEAYLARLLPDWKHQKNRKSVTTRCHAQEDDVESHQGHARSRQRIDEHDPTKQETLSRTAEKHEQVNMDCNGALVRD